MWHIKIFLLVISVIIGRSIAIEFPPGIQKCHYGDSQCFRETASNVIKKFPEGISAMSIQSIDPYFHDKIDLNMTGNSPLTVVMSYQNTTLFGYSKAKILEIEGFTKDPTKIQIHFTLGKIRIISKYKLKGQFLEIPVEGAGQSNTTMLDWDFYWNATVKLVERDNKKYLKIGKHNTRFTISRAWFFFENLFNGDQNLSKAANDFFNDNWEFLFNEMKPVLFKTAGKFFSALVGHPFSKIPYNDFFYKEN